MITQYPPVLPTGAATEATLDKTMVESTDTHLVLGKILKELKLMNLHFASMTGETLTMNDVNLGD